MLTASMDREHPRHKPALRRWMKQVRARLPAADAARASAAATRHALALPELDAGPICAFVSFGSEIATRSLLRALLDQGRVVGVPRVEGDHLVCRRIRSLDDLVPGRFGIPTSDGPDLGDRVRVVLAPGLAFTPAGERLGYGAGYYDRYLAGLSGAVAVGLCFEHQVLPEIPTGPRDRPMRAVVTDAGVHRGPPARAIRVVAGAVVRDGKVLVARRGPSMAQSGWWELPGGKVEPGESEPEALARELREELGIEVEVTAPLGVAIHPYPGLEVALAGWWCRLVRGAPAPVEHDAVRWVDAAGLRALGWAPADVPLVEAMVRAPGPLTGRPAR